MSAGTWAILGTELPGLFRAMLTGCGALLWENDQTRAVLSNDALAEIQQLLKDANDRLAAREAAALSEKR